MATDAAPADALIHRYSGVVCDMDGVVYRGSVAIPGAVPAIEAVRSLGVPVVFATNNAARTPDEVAEHLVAIGLPTPASQVVTAAQAGAVVARELLGPGEHRVMAFGGDGVREALREAGFDPAEAQMLSDERRAGDDGNNPVVAVVEGNGLDIRIRDFHEAARVLNTGVPWVLTNPDLTVPLPGGEAPGNGAFAQAMSQAVHRQPDVVAGKPFTPLYRLAVSVLGGSLSRCLAIGDRLDTDIEGAVAAGMDSALVLTGVHGWAEILETPAEHRPTYVLSDLSELLHPYAVTRTDDGFRSGDVLARWRDDVIDVGEGADRDRLRAAFALAVHRVDHHGLGVAQARASLDSLTAEVPNPS